MYDARKKRITLASEVSRGGEAVICEVKSAQGMLAKVYHNRPSLEYADKLEFMVNNPPADPTASLKHTSIAWPRELLYDTQRQVVGFTMPRVLGAHPILDFYNIKRRAKTAPGFNWRYLHITAQNLASAISAVHEKGYVVGDINESNIMVATTALITLIDTDSFQVRTAKGVHKCLVGKGEYTPPELQELKYADVVRAKEHDYFGLAVIIFQLLMAGWHPFRSTWRGRGDPPSLPVKIKLGLYPYGRNPMREIAPAQALTNLHPAIVDLFQRCFEDGHLRPDQRPNANEWQRVLGKAVLALRECPNKHIYSDHDQRGQCPLCTSGSTAHAQPGMVSGQQTSLAPAPQATMQCPNPACKYENKIHEIYCQRCLSPLQGEINCPMPNCGKKMPRGAPYCPWCGGSISKGVVRCPRRRCHFANQIGTIYCLRCAEQLVPNEPCPICRKPKPRGASFCPHGGH